MPEYFSKWTHCCRQTFRSVRASAYICHAVTSKQQGFLELPFLLVRSKTCHTVLLDRDKATCNSHGKDRTHPASCGVWCCLANHSIDNSQCGLTRWWIAQSSLIQKWRDESDCIKTQKKSTNPCTL